MPTFKKYFFIWLKRISALFIIKIIIEFRGIGWFTRNIASILGYWHFANIDEKHLANVKSIKPYLAQYYRFIGNISNICAMLVFHWKYCQGETNISKILAFDRKPNASKTPILCQSSHYIRCFWNETSFFASIDFIGFLLVQYRKYRCNTGKFSNSNLWVYTIPLFKLKPLCDSQYQFIEAILQHSTRFYSKQRVDSHLKFF